MNISQKSREVYDKIATGWNTWDIQSVTAHVYLPEKIRLHIGFMIPHLNSEGGNNLWDNVESFGEHSVGGSYTEVTIRYFGGIYKIETSAKGEELVIRITPEKIRTNCYVLAEISGIWGESPNICNIDSGVLATKGERSFMLRSLNNLSVPEWNPSYLSNITCLANETVYFSVNSIKTTKEIDRQLAEARKEWLESTIQATGKLEEGLTALRRSLLWNTIYDSINARVITPVSRDWSNPMKCRWSQLNINVFGDYVLFGWDTFFASLQFGLIDKALAYANIFQYLKN